MITESINRVRQLFEEFSLATDKDEAEGKLQQAVDAALDVIDGDGPEQARKTARNIVEKYCQDFLTEANARLREMKGSMQDMSTCDHYLRISEVFAQVRDDDRDLLDLQKQLHRLLAVWL